MKDNHTGSWNKVGETEVKKNNLHPNFKSLFSMNYMFEEKQECRFEVLDFDDNGKHDHIGECCVTLGAIVGSKNNIFISDLTDKKSNKKIDKSKIII